MNTWIEEFKTAVKNVEELESILGTKISKTNYPLFIPKNFLNKIIAKGSNSALWKQFIPDISENLEFGSLDPIGDQKFQVTKNLIHRYPNRALFLPTTTCPIICRYCFRKNELYDNQTFKQNLDETLTYLTAHPEIEEIIFTGGDPLILSNEKIENYFEAFSKIPTIKYIRFHSRTPVILPSRIDNGLIEVLNKFKKNFKQIVLMIHINHCDEIDHDLIQAIQLLRSNQIMIFSQTVLLKDVNDHAETLSNLFHELGNHGVIPYYLHHPDEAAGTKHFYLSLESGRKIYHQLRKSLPGWLIPTYIYDVPGGHGKVPAFNPENTHFSGEVISLSGEMIKLKSPEV